MNASIQKLQCRSIFSFSANRFCSNYRPQTKLRKGNVFTPAQYILGYTPWQTPLSRHPPLWEDTPLGIHLPGQTPPSWADTPWEDTPLLGRHPPGQTPPWADTFSRRPLQRTVRILLECFLVLFKRIEANREPTFYLFLQIIKELNRILTKSNSADGIILNCSSKTALLQCVTSMSFTLRIMSPSLFSCKSETFYFSTTTRNSAKKLKRHGRERCMVIKRFGTFL